MPLPDAAQWRRLSPLLDEALDLEPPARSAYLADLRRRDAALADELAVLLSGALHADAKRFLACSVDGDDAPAASLAGTRIGPYCIECPLGEGGTGAVWAARRSDGRFEGTVAIKLLHLSLVGRTGALRFEREGAILARLTHPHIARLLDAGVTDHGQPYLVLDLVQGERIDHYCDSRRLDVEQRLALFDDVLAAVAHAHSHLVVHRDLKPTNILVDTHGKVKLLDFGIAKMLEERSAGVTVTAEGQRALTPQYAAPEQLQDGPVTTATDVYSLGVLLYLLLAGQHPTSSGTASSVEVMRATLERPPPLMSASLAGPGAGVESSAEERAADRGTSAARLHGQLRGDLDNIVARALSKDPAQRYQTVAALAEDLHRHRTHQPVSARADSWIYRSAKLMRRHRGMVAASLVVAASVVAGLTGTLTQAQRARAAAAQALQERDRARTQLSYTRASGELINFLLQEGFDKPFSTTELLARAEQVLDSQFANDPAPRAHLRSIVAEMYQVASFGEKSETLLLRARADALAASDPLLLSTVECQLAYQYGNNGSFDKAVPLLEGAIARLHKASPAEQITLAGCLHARSEVVSLHGDVQAAFDDAASALDALRDAGPGDRSLALIARSSLANAEVELGRMADAARDYRRAIDEFTAMGRGSTRPVALLHNNMGWLLSRSGQTLAALESFQRAMEISSRFGPVEPVLEGNYANRLIELGRTQEAIPLIEHALATAKARGDRRNGPLLLTQGARAWCLVNDLKRCAEMLAAARSGLAAVLPPGHSMEGQLEVSEAQLDLARVDLPRARSRLNHAIAILDAASEKNPYQIRALSMLARVEQQMGDLAGAGLHADQAVARARAAMAGFPHSEWLGGALAARGLVHRARGETEAARDAWREALVEFRATVGDTAPATEEVRQLIGS